VTDAPRSTLDVQSDPPSPTHDIHSSSYILQQHITESGFSIYSVSVSIHCMLAGVDGNQGPGWESDQIPKNYDQA
jgi:hypothetical protein